MIIKNFEKIKNKFLKKKNFSCNLMVTSIYIARKFYKGFIYLRINRSVLFK